MEEVKTQKIKRIYRGWNNRAIIVLFVFILLIFWSLLINTIYLAKLYKQNNTLITQNNNVTKQNIIIIDHLEKLNNKQKKTNTSLNVIQNTFSNIDKIYVEKQED